MIIRLVFALAVFQIVSAKELDAQDMRRAEKPHAVSLLGHSPEEIHDILNNKLRSTFPNVFFKECQDFSSQELQELIKKLQAVRSNDVLQMYTPEDGRRGVALSSTMNHHEAMCFAIGLAWAHQLSISARASWTQPLPLLPRDTSKRAISAVDSTAAEVVSCETGHNATPIANDSIWEGFPRWPNEVSYHARGYGPYTFWTEDSPRTGALNGTGALIKVKYSAIKNAERFDHESCTLADGSQEPCSHLFVDGKWAYLFAADEKSWCCISSRPDLSDNCWLSAVQPDFYSLFQDNGISYDYSSESGLYTGPVRNYTLELTRLGNADQFVFWYYTSPDGMPVEQGEGSCVTPRGCSGAAKYLFHQYNRSTFQESIFQDSEFAVPNICLTTTDTCFVSPSGLCDNSTTTSSSYILPNS